MLGEGMRPRPPTVAEAAALVKEGKATPFSVVYSWRVPLLLLLLCWGCGCGCGCGCLAEAWCAWGWALALPVRPPASGQPPLPQQAHPPAPLLPGCWHVWAREWSWCRARSLKWPCGRPRRWAPNTCWETGTLGCAAQQGWACSDGASWCSRGSGTARLPLASPMAVVLLPHQLCRRPISVTMARVWAALSGWEKARLLGSLLLMGAG